MSVFEDHFNALIKQSTKATIDRLQKKTRHFEEERGSSLYSKDYQHDRLLRRLKKSSHNDDPSRRYFH